MFSQISIVKQNEMKYPNQDSLFRPSVSYPEYVGKIALEKNETYNSVREALHLQGWDEENFGTENWNPLKKLVKPGDNVLIKPNLVMDKNQSGDGVECLYTQPAVVAPIIDYVIIALKGKGKIIVGDAPMQECDFSKLIEESGYKKLIEYYSKMGNDIKLVDFRELTAKVQNGIYKQSINDNNTGKKINLGNESEHFFETKDKVRNYRITNYDPRELEKHHTIDKHEYYVSDYLLESNVVINMPKPKTHRKAGVTISLKNMVGINVRKEYLPHHTKGAIEEGGDEYRKKSIVHSIRSNIVDKRNVEIAKKRFLYAKTLDKMRQVCSIILRIHKSEFFDEGSWYGNNTISKTILDLNKIVFYADKEGKLQEKPQRKNLIVADMIISGEKDGPVCPSAKDVGIVALGTEPIAFDKAIATLMGFDISKIPTLEVTDNLHGKYLLNNRLEPYIISNDIRYNRKKIGEINKKDLFHYIPTSGWRNYIEMI